MKLWYMCKLWTSIRARGEKKIRLEVFFIFIVHVKKKKEVDLLRHQTAHMTASTKRLACFRICFSNKGIISLLVVKLSEIGLVRRLCRKLCMFRSKNHKKHGRAGRIRASWNLKDVPMAETRCSRSSHSCRSLPGHSPSWVWGTRKSWLYSQHFDFINRIIFQHYSRHFDFFSWSA